MGINASSARKIHPGDKADLYDYHFRTHPKPRKYIDYLVACELKIFPQEVFDFLRTVDPKLWAGPLVGTLKEEGLSGIVQEFYESYDPCKSTIIPLVLALGNQDNSSEIAYGILKKYCMGIEEGDKRIEDLVGSLQAASASVSSNMKNRDATQKRRRYAMSLLVLLGHKALKHLKGKHSLSSLSAFRIISWYAQDPKRIEAYDPMDEFPMLVPKEHIKKFIEAGYDRYYLLLPYSKEGHLLPAIEIR